MAVARRKGHKLAARRGPRTPRGPQRAQPAEPPGSMERTGPAGTVGLELVGPHEALPVRPR
eukprot:14789193-Heterocapsa_arctica.AAC.1